MIKKIIRQLKESGIVCVIYMKGVYSGITCQIQDYDDDFLQIVELKWKDNELWAQSVLRIDDISKLDYYHKTALEKANENGLKALPYKIESNDNI